MAGATRAERSPAATKRRRRHRAGALFPDVPARWQRALVVLVCAAAAVFVLDHVLGWLLAKVRVLLDILSPLVVAFAIAYVFDPLVDRFEELGWSRKLAIAFVAVTGVVLGGLAVVLLVPSIMEQGRELGPRLGESWAHAVQGVENGLESVLGWLRELGVPVPAEEVGLRGALERAAANLDWSSLAERVGEWAREAMGRGFAAVAFVLNIVLVPILAVYLLHDIDVIKERIGKLIPPRHRERVLEPLSEIDSALAGFVRGQLIVAAILGVLYMLGLWISRAPLGLAIGFFAGALSFIPYLGILLGLVPAILLTGLEHGFISWNVLGVALTFGVAQFLEGNFITPRIMGRTIGLHPVLVIVAVVVGGTLFGLVGMLLAVPAAATLVVLLRLAHSHYEESEIFLGRKERTPAPEETEPSPRRTEMVPAAPETAPVAPQGARPSRKKRRRRRRKPPES